MSGIVPFDFESHAVRVVMQDGAPWFVAADVCRVLEHSNASVALRRLDDDERGVSKVYTLGGEQEMKVVSESGLFALILTSRKPAAKRFRKWVTAEVLPTIRKHGHYAMPGSDHDELAAKRVHFQTLPESHQELAGRRVAALTQLEELIEGGMRIGEAVEAVAEDMALAPRTIWNYRRSVYMVPRADWGAAVAPKWSGPRGMLADCHPEAIKLMADLALSGARMRDCYRRVLDAAAENGWSPVPSEKTLVRAVRRMLPANVRAGGAA